MFTETLQTHPEIKQRVQFPTILLATLLVGLALGRLFTAFWPELPFLASIGMWPMGTAVAMILGALLSFYFSPEPNWSYAVGGQLLGVVAMALVLLGVLL